LRVLVMGGTGFVGSAICAAMRAHGDDVVAAYIAPPRPATSRLLEGIPFIGVRVQDFYEVLGAVRDTGPDVLVNLSYIAGAASEQAPFMAGLVNLQGPMNCLEAAAFCGVRRVVYASSIAVYGPDQQLYGEREVTEDDSCPIAAHTLSYGATKAINEFMTRKLAQHHGLDVTALRLSIVFGAGREKGFTTWASDIGSLPAVGEEVAIPYRAEQRSSLIYVDDAADLFVRAAHDARPGVQIYNSGGHSVTMKQLADAIISIEPAARVRFAESASDQPFVSRVSGARVFRDLGFRLTTLDAALRHHMDQARVARGLEPRYRAGSASPNI
jgi:nucleoside-diphosphate-sugar epimerase